MCNVAGCAFRNMLPSLDKLSLAPDPAPMGEFYALSEQEAAERNANGGKEPLTFDDYVPNRTRGQEGATFRLYWDQKRVLRNPPGHRSAEEVEAHRQSLYEVYDARALWGWVKTHEKDPTNSFKISREDWMELHAEYDKFGEIPAFVNNLPSLEWPNFGPGTVWVWQKSGVHEFANNKPWTGGRWVAIVDGVKRFKTFVDFTANSQKADFLPTDGYYYSGPPGEEYLTKIRQGEWVDFLMGPKGQEKVYKETMPGGDTRFYATDEEPRVSRHQAPPNKYRRGRLLRQTDGTGLKTWYFKGPRTFERLDYLDNEILEVDGLVERAYYTGKRGLERVYKVERFSRTQNDRLYDTHYLRGPRGEEKVYKRVGGDDGEWRRNDWVAYYETGEEHPQALRRVESVSYQDEQGRSFGPGEHEDLLKFTTTYYYEGPRGAETFVRNKTTITKSDGTYGGYMDDELPEDDPERMEFAQRMYNHTRHMYSAWAPVDFLDGN